MGTNCVFMFGRISVLSTQNQLSFVCFCFLLFYFVTLVTVRDCLKHSACTGPTLVKLQIREQDLISIYFYNFY